MNKDELSNKLESLRRCMLVLLRVLVIVLEIA